MATEVKEENNSASSDIKNEDVEDKNAEGEKVDNIEDGKKNETNEVKAESEKEESGEDDDDDEKELGLLDRPVEVTGCRARKKVERFNMSYSAPKEKVKEIAEGKGKKLGDCPRIDAQIQKKKAVDLKQLHKVLFNRIGSANEVKKNIRKFSGFPFEKDSTDFTRKKASVEKLLTSALKEICEVLDIERGGTKDELVNRIMDFLLNPVDSGKQVPKPKKKTSKDKKKSITKKTKADKKNKEKESNDENDGEDDSTGGDASMGGTDEENEEASSSDEPKKKSKETKSKAKSKSEKTKKEEKKSKGTKRKMDDSEGSEDEQPAKKAKMPSDDEISKLVKQILDDADLQEITMKKVIKQVSDAFPDFDLSHKKAFIKSTIKSVLKVND